MSKGIGGHQSPSAVTTSWLTPPHVLEGLGGADLFDLDPCGSVGSPIPCARRSICLPENGLAATWDGRVWLNPPYSTGEVEAWLERMAAHGEGVALIFARTETDTFHRWVWGAASGLLFLAGRLHFHYPDGTRAKANAGAPSVLCAYGPQDLDRLAASPLPGAMVPLRFPRGALVALADGASWRDAVLAWVKAQDGPVCVSDAYRAFARHPKTKRNPNWRAKIRQTLQRGPFAPLGGGIWQAIA